MIDPVQILAIMISVILLLVVLELVRRHLLGEEYAFVWIAGGLGLLALSIWRGALDAVARWLGVHYGPALLVLLLGVFVFIALLFFSVVISRQRTQIERLIEDVAILQAQIRERSAEEEATDPAQDFDGPLSPLAQEAPDSGGRD